MLPVPTRVRRIVKKTASEDTSGAGAAAPAVSGGVSSANATSRSSNFGAPPFNSASLPPNQVLMRSASRSASAPVGFASSAACRDFGVSAAASCAWAAAGIIRLKKANKASFMGDLLVAVHAYPGWERRDPTIRPVFVYSLALAPAGRRPQPARVPIVSGPLY